MYNSFFGLKELPFRLAADPRYHFLAESQESARVRLRNGLRDTDGCLLLMGEAGTGKTNLALDLLQELPETHVLVQVRNPDLSVAEFYQTVQWFDSNAAAEVFRFAGGVPRLINTLADAALVQAFDGGRERVEAMDVRAAADKSQWVEYAAPSLDVSTGSNPLVRLDAEQPAESEG